MQAEGLDLPEPEQAVKVPAEVQVHSEVSVRKSPEEQPAEEQVRSGLPVLKLSAQPLAVVPEHSEVPVQELAVQHPVQEQACSEVPVRNYPEVQQSDPVKHQRAVPLRLCFLPLWFLCCFHQDMSQTQLPLPCRTDRVHPPAFLHAVLLQ